MSSVTIPTSGKANEGGPSLAPIALGRQVGGEHYLQMKIQPVEFAIANDLDFFQKDIVKYTTRRKGDHAKRLEDLHKAKHYLEMYIVAVEEGYGS